MKGVKRKTTFTTETRGTRRKKKILSTKDTKGKKKTAKDIKPQMNDPV
jgi:hypothetical protein